MWLTILKHSQLVFLWVALTHGVRGHANLYTRVGIERLDGWLEPDFDGAKRVHGIEIRDYDCSCESKQLAWAFCTFSFYSARCLAK